MRLGRAPFEVTEHLFFAQQAAGRARVVGHENRCRGVHVSGQPFEHDPDFRLALGGEGKPALQPLGRESRKTGMRAAMNAILYLLRTGCPWRCLPRDSFPLRSTVYSIFRKF